MGTTFHLFRASHYRMNECLTTPQHEKQIGYWVPLQVQVQAWFEPQLIFQLITVYNKKKMQMLSR